MRAIIVSLVAVASVMGPAALVQAAPTALHRQAVTDPAITMVWQRCGHGFHRGNDAWKDKGGGWHGTCVPNKPKAASHPPVNAPSLSGTTTEQLNQQELSRLQTGTPPAR